MPFTTLFNGQLCKNGEVVEEPIVVSSETGRIVNRDTGGSFIGGDAVDLEERIVAPGYLELQTNGMNGFHFSNFSGEEEYQSGLKDVSRFLVKKGVTGFWATLPTVAEEQYHKVTDGKFRSQNSVLILWSSRFYRHFPIKTFRVLPRSSALM